MRRRELIEYEPGQTSLCVLICPRGLNILCPARPGVIPPDRGYNPNYYELPYVVVNILREK